MRFLVLLLPALAGCMFWRLADPLAATSSSDWLETGPVRRSKEDVAQTARDCLLRAGYPLPPFDPAATEIETDWITHLAPQWRDGFRTRVDVELVPLSEGAINVRIKSYREINDEGKWPMIAEKATWIGASIDDRHKQFIPEPALKLQQQLKLKFFGLNP
jgi:hypothetical protein